MYSLLKSQIAALLCQPRPLKPQTERHVASYLQDHGGDIGSFLTRAHELLEEHELDILFGPVFTPTLDDQAAVSDVLSEFRPSPADLEKLQAELCAAKSQAAIELPDGSLAKLPLHEVMISRFVKLMRLDQAPDFKTAAQLQDTLPSDLCALALALMRQRGFTPQRQTWLASFLRHMARRQPLDRGVLVECAQFVLGQCAFDTPSLQRAAAELVRAAKGSAEYVRAGRMYWSPDVAQHHQYRGEGRVDETMMKQKLDELAALEAIEAGLGTFGEVKPQA